MLNKYPLVYVEWEDHSAEGGWSHEEDEVPTNTLCGSVGWLFRETESSIVLISSLCEDTRQVGNKQIIARKLIHAVRTLRKPGSRGKGNGGSGSGGKTSAQGASDRASEGVKGKPGSDSPAPDAS